MIPIASPNGNFNAFGETFARLGALGQDQAFELRFRQMERTVIERINKEIDDIRSRDRTGDELARLQNERNKLVDKMPSIQKFQFSARGNIERLSNANVQASEARAGFIDFQALEVKDTLTQEDADFINARIKKTVDRLDNIIFIQHPDISRGHAILRLRELADELRSMKAVAGPVDAPGATPPTNDNRKIYDTLGTTINAIATAETVNEDTRGQAHKLLQVIERQVFQIDAKATELETVSAARILDEIEDVKIRNSNLLRAISLSYEVGKDFTSYLADGLGTQRPPTGSILNLFT